LSATWLAEADLDLLDPDREVPRLPVLMPTARLQPARHSSHSMSSCVAWPSSPHRPAGTPGSGRWGVIWPEVAVPRELAAMLRGAEIAPRKIRIDGKPVQGYDKRDFVPHWNSDVPAANVA
jgi:hypothetical protein